eukprot:506322-Amphidinium_carterae.1
MTWLSIPPLSLELKPLRSACRGIGRGMPREKSQDSQRDPSFAMLGFCHSKKRSAVQACSGLLP